MNKNYHKNIDSILPKVMLVEDEISIIEVLEIMFNDYGYSFEKCSDERKAVAKIKQFNPDIILQDIKMPNIPGCELIKDYRKFTDVPIIMVTAVSEKGKMKECLELGADDYLVKPYDIHDLLAKVNAQFRRYKIHAHIMKKQKWSIL
ncbi:MAG: response regulator transcription factor [Bifidobacteriaceae bacterium]|jgi:DNA-binding response OmpR family regulator|nr:response regulator transcription factor [Bifidobacteriaceae bacterium]